MKPRVQTAAQTEDIVARAVKGQRAARIARELSLPAALVRQTIRNHALRIRSQYSDVMAQRFLRHDELLTRLIEQWSRALAAAFDRDIATALIRAMERQSRLLGLERALEADKWLNEASDEQLLRELEDTYGIKVKMPGPPSAN